MPDELAPAPAAAAPTAPVVETPESRAERTLPSQPAPAATESIKQDLDTSQGGGVPPDTDIDDSDAEPKTGDEGEGEGQPDKPTEAEVPREERIPKTRLDEVAAERDRYSAELEQMKADQALTQRANKAGYSDKESYRQANEWAVTNGYGTIENYNDFIAKEREIETDAKYFGISEEVKRELLQTHLDGMQLRKEMQDTRQSLQQFEGQTLNTVISDFRNEHSLTPEQTAAFESIIKKGGAKPEGVRMLFEAIKPMLKVAGQNAVIESNAKKTANSNGGAPAPEGRGGGTAPPPPKRDLQSIINTPLTQLLGWHGKKG